MFTLLGWLVAGLIVGAIARLLVPGRQAMGIAMTIVLGIVGAIVGGFISSLIFGPTLIMDNTGTYAVETAWPGWIMSILGAVLVLWIVMTATGNRGARRWW